MLQKANRYPRHGDFEEFTAEAESESPEYSAALASSSQSVTEVSHEITIQRDILQGVSGFM